MSLFTIDEKTKKTSNTSRVIDYVKLSELFHIDLKNENNTFSEIQSTVINALASTSDYFLISNETKSLLVTRSALTEKELLKKSESEANEKKQFNALREIVLSSVYCELRENEDEADYRDRVNTNELSIISDIISHFEKSISENAIKQNYSKKIRIAIFNERVTDKQVEYLKQYCFSYALHFISFTEKIHVKTYKDNYLSHVISIAK